MEAETARQVKTVPASGVGPLCVHVRRLHISGFPDPLPEATLHRQLSCHLRMQCPKKTTEGRSLGRFEHLLPLQKAQREGPGESHIAGQPTAAPRRRAQFR